MPCDVTISDSVVSGRATCVFRCAADAKCTFEAKRRRFVVAHVLKVHVAEERVRCGTQMFHLISYS